MSSCYLLLSGARLFKIQLIVSIQYKAGFSLILSMKYLPLDVTMNLLEDCQFMQDIEIIYEFSKVAIMTLVAYTK